MMGNQAKSDQLGQKVLTWIIKVDITIELVIVDEHMKRRRNWLMFFLLLSCHVVCILVLILLCNF